MAKTATLSIRIEPKAKSQAEKIFAKLGITLSEAVNMFIHQSVIERALPFQPRAERPKIPNAATRAAMREVNAHIVNEDSAPYGSSAEMFKDLGI